MNTTDETSSAKIEFRARSGEAPITLCLTKATAELHKSPERIRKIMELLELPEGAVATVVVSASSTVVR